MFVYPGNVFTNYMTAQKSGSGPSNTIWSRLAPGGSNPLGDRSCVFFDDFLSFQGVTDTTAAGKLQPGNGYFAYIEADTTDGAILPVATHQGGVIKLLTSTDSADGDNHQTVLTSGGNAAGMAAITQGKKLAFEARIQLASVTNGDGSVFVGLGEEGLAAAATPLTDSTGHVTADKDLLGFAVFEADNDALKMLYRKAGGAVQTVATYDTALAAGAWYKVGLVHDPSAPPSKRLTWFVNGSEQPTYTTQADIDADTFPRDEELALVASIIASANNDPQNFLVDWWGLGFEV